MGSTSVSLVHRIQLSSSVRVSVRESRYFTMTGVASEMPQPRPLSADTRPRARHDDGARRNHERTIGAWLDHDALDQVEDRRRARDDRAGGDHRASLDDGAFVDARVTADKHIVFDDDRQRADRLDHAADLRAGAHVHARADLRARSDERVRIDERLLADVGANVHEHRRHADHARRDDTRRRAPTNPPGTMRMPAARPGFFSGSVSLS